MWRSTSHEQHTKAQGPSSRPPAEGALREKPIAGQPIREAFTMVRERHLIVNTVYEPLTAYRIVRDIDRDDPRMLDTFRSNYERNAPPLGIEFEMAVIHLGLSMHLRRELAAATSRRWPRLGRHVAEVELRAGNGFCWAHTVRPGHITVWGRPVQLLACVVDILPVED